MSETRRIQPDTLLRFARACILGMGAKEESARVVADHLVQSNLYGHDSHGVLRLPQYREAIETDLIDPLAEIEIVQERDTTAVIDSHKSWGPVGAQAAMDLAVEKARKHAVAAVSLRNSSHIGRVGAYAQDAARHGFVAQIYCGCTGGSCVAPWGGTEARLSTNPIVVAIPTRKDPVVVDMTTSTIAEGKLRLARNAGKPVPLGYILDRDGKDTTSATDFYDGGTILPLGGGLLGHKGYALGLVVELLGSVLAAGSAAFPGTFRNNAAFMQVTDPTAFADREEFYSQCDEVFENLRSSARKEGVDEILLPGEIETRREEERRRDGIELDGGTLGSLEELAEKLGIEKLGTRNAERGA